MRACLICEQSFEGHHRSRYCSDECRAERDRRRALAYYYDHKEDPALKERVKRASRANYDRIKADPEALAKQRAMTAQWRAAHPEAVSEQYRRWRIANPDSVRTKVQRRRARLLDAFIEDVDPAQIWVRDAGMCGICQRQIDPLLAWPHRMSKTLDHIIPLARGGTHEPANVQLAHAVCNSRKNDRLDVAVEPQEADEFAPVVARDLHQ